MIKYADQIAYRTALSLKNQYIFYTGFFLNELSYFFQTSQEDKNDSHDAWLFFDKGKIILFFNRREISFFEEKISLIEKNYLDKNVIPIINDPLALEIIRTAEITHHIDSDFSAEIWLHPDDVKFVVKYMIPNLTIDQIHQKFWIDQWEYRITTKEAPLDRLHFYLYNSHDKVVVNYYVAADIINNLKITNFYIGRQKEIVIPNRRHHLLRRKLIDQYPHLCFFQKAKQIIFLND